MNITASLLTNLPILNCFGANFDVLGVDGSHITVKFYSFKGTKCKAKVKYL